MGNKSPHLPAILIVMAVRRCDTPPLGKYLLCIAPAAARATANKTTMTNAPTLLSVLMAVAASRYYTTGIA